jgi:hypothetical protein
MLAALGGFDRGQHQEVKLGGDDLWSATNRSNLLSSRWAYISAENIRLMKK